MATLAQGVGEILLLIAIIAMFIIVKDKGKK